MIINQSVITPLGKGLVQGAFAVLGHDGSLVSNGVLVRLPINDVTKAQLKQSNCITPHAVLNGLWVFQASELK